MPPVTLKADPSKATTKINPESSASLERGELGVGTDVWWQWGLSRSKEVRAG